MQTEKGAIKGLGEIALPVNSLDLMRSFYEEVIGLPVWRKLHDPPSVFFKVADGYSGHTRVLVLFDRSSTPGYSGLDTES